LHNNDIKIIRFTLEDNGFRDLKTAEKSVHNEFTIQWQIGPIKRQVYEQLTRY